MNAVFKLAKPAVHSVAGAFPLAYPAATDGTQSCPPFAHSHAILSFLSRPKGSTECYTLQPDQLSALPPLKFHDHEDVTNGGNDNQKWPQDSASPGPYVRPL
jgi:hypothetical protein